MLELLVKVININLPTGHAILKRCKPLNEYSWFIQKVKEHMQEELDELLESVEQICATVDKCGLDADPQEIYEQMGK